MDVDLICNRRKLLLARLLRSKDFLARALKSGFSIGWKIESAHKGSEGYGTIILSCGRLKGERIREVWGDI
jgi:hypothetical protein